MDKEEKNKIINHILTNRGIEKEKKGFEKDSIIPEMKEKFRQEGYDFKYYFEIENICANHPKETKELLLYFYKKAKLDSEKEWFVNMLNMKENKDLVPFFIEEFLNCKEGERIKQINIGNFLYRFLDKKYLDDYIKILQNNNFNILPQPYADARTYLLPNIGRFKDERVKEVILEIIDQPTLAFWCIKCLDKYKDESLRPVFEKYLNDESIEVRRCAKKAIENLDKQKLRRESK